MAKHKTPLLDQLETGPWPSFVSDIKQEAETRAKNEKELNTRFRWMFVMTFWALLELVLCTRNEPTGNTAALSVFSVTAAALSEDTAISREMFPGVAHFHTMRVSQPGGKFYTTEYLKDSFATSGNFAAAVSPICTDPPEISFCSAPQPRSWKKSFLN